jgi:hypothetical protein
MIDIKSSTPTDGKHMGAPITLDEFTDWLYEMENQPVFRARMDKEMDYLDGNQLGSDLLQKLKEVGIPPAVDNIILPAMQTLAGLEVKTRKDWRVTPDGDPQGQDVADALNYKLNQAERHSKADDACASAFWTQAAVGLGWVEVSRESDPFRYPYRCTTVHRNEIFWDMLGKEVDTSDWRYLNRRRWMPTNVAAASFPQHRELIERINRNWGDEWTKMLDGGTGTGLMDSWQTQRDWSIEEQQWHDSVKQRVLVQELWYRRWVQVPVLMFRRGNRAVEYDRANPAHTVAIAQGLCDVVKATVSRVRRSYWLGPHLLHDGPSPYRHSYFGYVPFLHQKDDRTGVPYGVVKSMVFHQDNLNSGVSKMRWGMSAMRVELTKGAVSMTDAAHRAQVARPDAIITLNADHMAQPGARYEVKRDYQLNDQHYNLIQDARASIERASGITAGFSGQKGTATSGLQEQTQVEQSTQALSGLMDKFGRSRAMVGEMLMSLIIEDMGKEETTVVIEGDAVRPERTVVLNHPEVDPATGIQYLSNDVQRIRLKVALEDVPTTSSFRAQQMTTMGEAIKAMPPNMQAAVMPFFVGLMDLPQKRLVVEAIRAASAQETPEGVEQRIQEAVQQALKDAGNELKSREVAIKERKADAEIAKLVAEAVQTGIKSAFGAIQSGQLIAQMPQIAPIGDILLKNAGWQPPAPEGVDPNMPIPNVSVPQGVVNPGDTSPQTPSDPASPIQGENMGINTMRSEV